MKLLKRIARILAIIGSLFTRRRNIYYYYDPECEDLWWSYLPPGENLTFILDPMIELLDSKQAKKQQKILNMPFIPYGWHEEDTITKKQ